MHFQPQISVPIPSLKSQGNRDWDLGLGQQEIPAPVIIDSVVEYQPLKFGIPNKRLFIITHPPTKNKYPELEFLAFPAPNLSSNSQSQIPGESGLGKHLIPAPVIVSVVVESQLCPASLYLRRFLAGKLEEVDEGVAVAAVQPVRLLLAWHGDLGHVLK